MAASAGRPGAEEDAATLFGVPTRQHRLQLGQTRLLLFGVHQESLEQRLGRLLDLMEETGPFGTLILMGYDWDDKPSWLRSMELFSKELMPALNRAVAGVSV